jgi:hypothetical protein
MPTKHPKRPRVWVADREVRNAEVKPPAPPVGLPPGARSLGWAFLWSYQPRRPGSPWAAFFLFLDLAP